MESPVGALSSTPPSAVWPINQDNSERPIPNPKAQGSDDLVHRGELQHMAAELGRVQPLLRSFVPEPRLCMEVSPTISSWYRSTSRTSSGFSPPNEVTFHVPMASVTRIGSLGPPPMTATQITLHQPPLNPPAGGEPTGGRAHVSHSGCAWPGPVGKDPATRRLPACPNPMSGSRVGWGPSEAIPGNIRFLIVNSIIVFNINLI